MKQNWLKFQMRISFKKLTEIIDISQNDDYIKTIDTYLTFRTALTFWFGICHDIETKTHDLCFLNFTPSCYFRVAIQAYVFYFLITHFSSTSEIKTTAKFL